MLQHKVIKWRSSGNQHAVGSFKKKPHVPQLSINSFKESAPNLVFSNQEIFPSVPSRARRKSINQASNEIYQATGTLWPRARSCLQSDPSHPKAQVCREHAPFLQPNILHPAHSSSAETTTGDPSVGKSHPLQYPRALCSISKGRLVHQILTPSIAPIGLCQ